MKASTKSARRPPRVGAVNYLNSKPLIAQLAVGESLQLVLDLPSRLADSLASEQLDLALIPSVELFHHPDYQVVSDACIACRGPVLSVKLFFRVPPAKVGSLALDEGSRTSALLAQLLLEERYGLTPATSGLPVGEGLDATPADAVLLIGDRAITADEGPFCEVWDLGEAWCRSTGLPFVFAVWAARPGAATAELDDLLREARDRGVARISQIAASEAATVGIPAARCQHYLRNHLHFTLGREERRGLSLFYESARKRRLVPEGWEFSYDGCAICQP
jgi:chorismate dehydratase